MSSPLTYRLCAALRERGLRLGSGEPAINLSAEFSALLEAATPEARETAIRDLSTAIFGEQQPDTKAIVKEALTDKGLQRLCPEGGSDDRCCLFSYSWPACEWAKKFANASRGLVERTRSSNG